VLLTQVWQDCDVTSSALYYSLPNSSALAFLRERLRGGTFVDVGAKVGLVSLLVPDKVKHAILFEPNPQVGGTSPGKFAHQWSQVSGLRSQVSGLT